MKMATPKKKKKSKSKPKTEPKPSKQFSKRIKVIQHLIGEYDKMLVAEVMDETGLSSYGARTYVYNLRNKKRA